MGSYITKEIYAWGKYPKETCHVYRPEQPEEVKSILGSREQEHWIAYGLGRSYGDAPLNRGHGVIQTERLNHMLEFDADTGLLTCEAGVSLDEIIEVFLPRGYFLPVTPGTKYVTVGGAIANDIHGKNHHVDGCFSEFVHSFMLLTASGDVIRCSREENRDLFYATVGGIGLTGVILTATIQLIRVETAYMNVTYEKARNLDEALELFIQNDRNYKYSVAWIDCLAKGDYLGRSVLMRGNHAQKADLPHMIKDPLSFKQKQKWAVPFDFPSFTLNSYSVKAFNQVYYSSYQNSTKLVDMTSFFHPLDSIMDWNRLYGGNGFVQYQAVFPEDQRPEEGLRTLLTRLSDARVSSFLAVLKSSGPANEGLLSFPMKGYTLALDIPIKGPALFRFLRELDEIVLAHGGRVYLAKDSTLEPEVFQRMYPRWRDMVNLKKDIDPHGVFSSSMSRRLGLT